MKRELWRKHSIFALVCVAVVIAALFTSGSSSVPRSKAVPEGTGAPLRILPLGDSITAGIGPLESYRVELNNLFKNSDYDVEFVGSKTDKYGLKHEGWPGATSGAILAKIASPSYSIPRPDIVLLHLGTNDMLLGKGVSETDANLRNIIKSLRDHNKSVTVLIAKLIPAFNEDEKSQFYCPKQPCQDGIEALNGNEGIPKIVTDLNTYISRVILVDQFGTFTQDGRPKSALYYDDKTHPNKDGEKAMAATWFDEIRDVAAHQRIQSTILTAAGHATPGAQFGSSIASSRDGTTIAVGAPHANSGRGAAYVFRWVGAAWSAPILLPVDGIAAEDRLRGSVAVSELGNTVVVGALGDAGRGTAYIFEWNGTSWEQQAALTVNRAVIRDDWLSVAISGETIVVGGYGHDAVYVFRRSGTGWDPAGRLPAAGVAPGDWFGWSVAIDGTTAIVGAPYDDGHRGSAYVFHWNGTSWSQQAKLTGFVRPNGLFGFSVDIHGDVAVVGARWDYNEGGSAHIFGRSGTRWNWERKQRRQDGAEYGFSVATDGQRAVVGAPRHQALGSIDILRGASWTRQATLISSKPDSRFGWSVALSGDRVIVGVPLADDRGIDSGAVYVFSETATAITLVSFEAIGDETGVRVTWQTGTEVDSAGFNVWRSEGEEDEYTQINGALIPAEGDPVSGASYTHTDNDVVKEVTYYYKLEDVDIHGVSAFHGPMSATPGRIHWIYLPLVLK